MRFTDWYNLKEEEQENAEIDNLFNQAELKIDKWFQQLYQGMLNTWGKGASPFSAKVKAGIINDLQNLLAKVRGGQQTYPMPAAAEAKPPTKEAYVLDIASLLEEADSAIAGLIPQRTTDAGKPVISAVDVLNNIKTKIMGLMRNLRDEILVRKVGSLSQQVGGMGDKLRQLPRNVGNNVRKSFNQSLDNKLANFSVKPFMGFSSGKERSNARMNLQDLGVKMANHPDIPVKLYRGKTGTQAVVFDPQDPQSIANIIAQADKDNNRMFRIRAGVGRKAKDHVVDLGDDTSFGQVMHAIYDEQI